MGRSLKKGPYVVERLLEKVMRADASGSREPIKTWARACTIVPEFVGKHFAIHNGRKFVKLYVTEDMVEPQARRVRPDPDVPRATAARHRSPAGPPRSKSIRPRVTSVGTDPASACIFQ